MRKPVVRTFAAAAAIVGGSIGVAALNPFSIASAQTTPSTSTAPAANGKSGSNEDPTHEAGESAAREAAEDSGQFHGGGHFRHGGGSNEDPTHEAGESAAREAQEDAPGTAPTAPAPTANSGAL
jgi:hypothetical protein